MNFSNDALNDCVRSVLSNIAALRDELNKLQDKASFKSAELSNIKHLAYEVWVPLLNCEGVAEHYLWMDRELAANFKDKICRIVAGAVPLVPSEALGAIKDIENRVKKHAEEYARDHHQPNPDYLRAAGPDGLGGIHRPVGGPKVDY